MTKLFDSHSHLYMEELAPDADEVLARMKDAGVVRTMVIGCDEISSREAIRFAKEHVGRGVSLGASVGVHPHDASSVIDGLPEELTDLANDERVRAIGEIGLDYFYDSSPRDVQARVFAEQIEWAVRVRMPMVIHLRSAKDPTTGDAYRDAYRIMREHGAEKCGGIIHCFSGGVDEARRAIDMGFHVSFAGPVTYPKSDALRDAAKFVPDDMILCETDSPYLAPQSRRGKRNEPANVREVYEMIADLRGMDLDGFAERVWINGESLLGPA